MFDLFDLDDEVMKLAAIGIVSVLGIIFLAFFFVYVAIPFGAIAIGYLGYRAYQEHPSTRGRRLQTKATELRQVIANAQQDGGAHAFSDFDAFGSFLSRLDIPQHSGVAEPLFEVCRQLYAEEHFSGELPKLPDPCTNLDWARHVDSLSRIAAKLPNKNSPRIFAGTVLNSLRAFRDAIPVAALEAPMQSYSVLASGLVKNVPSVIEQMILPFYAEDAGDLFIELRKQLDRNLHEMSGVPYSPENYDSPHLVSPTKHKGTPLEIVNGYLRHTPIRQLFQAHIPISIPQKPRFEGTWVVAPSGTGKTTLLSQMLKGDLEEVKAGRASIIVMDSKGELTGDLARLARFAPGGDLEGKLVLIEPHPQLAINPLDLAPTSGHTIDLVEYLFSFGLPTTDLQSALLRSVLLALQNVPNASFNDLRKFLRYGWQQYEPHIETLQPALRDFFMAKVDGKQSEFDGKEYQPRRRELLARIQDITTRVPMLDDMFSAPKTRIDLGAQMDAGKVIVIDNSRRVLGEGGSEFFGRIFLALIRGDAERRANLPEAGKLPCYVYIDECDTIISSDENVNTILTKCRSQKIALILAHQKLADIKSDIVKAALRDSAVRFANLDSEAKALSPLFNADDDFIRNLGRGRFALYIRGEKTGALAVTVQNDPISAWPRMSDVDFGEIQRQMRDRYCHTPPTAGVTPLREAAQDPEPFLPLGDPTLSPTR